MKNNKSGLIMLGIVIVLYVVLFSVKPDKVFDALGESLGVLKMIIPILLIVFFLMALLNTFIDEKAISKHLGEQSGLKGWLLSLVGGVLSHGPGYVWYPLIQNLREQGARDGLVIAFIYARAIKIPWLPLMVTYFGMTFTLVYTFYVVLGAYLQGMIVNMFDNKEKNL